MNFDKLNQWLSLAANLGVLAGIIFVGLELSQTQISMEAQSSTTRAEMTIENRRYFSDNQLNVVLRKIPENQEISISELASLQTWYIVVLRQIENLHYQHELGVLDEEIWQSNYSTLITICRSPGFRNIYPNWEESPISERVRASFSKLIQNDCYANNQ